MDITEQLTHESRIALAAAAEITRLRAEVEALRADAERYRWLRDGSNPPWVMQMLERYADNGSDFDAEVDAARAAQGERG